MTEGNLGPSEGSKRLIVGLAALALAAGVAITGLAATLFGGTLLVLFFWLSGLGLIQAKEKT